MKTELRRKRMKLGPTDTVIEESPDKFALYSAIPDSLQMSQLVRRSSFYSENPSRNVSKYTKLEERMTQKLLSPPSQKFDSTYVAGSWLTSPRRITPKALFRSLLSPSPSDKSSTNLPRKLDLKSPVRNVGSCASLDFRSPVKIVGPCTSTAVVASPPRSMACSLSHLDLDSPSRNTRSHVYSWTASDKSSTNLPRKLNLKSPVRNIGSCASQDFRSPVKMVEPCTSTAVVASPPRSMTCSLSDLDLDSPSRNTRSHFRSPVKMVEPCTSTAVVASPPRSMACSLSHLDSDSPSRNTRSHVYSWTALSFGCDVESQDAAIVGHSDKVNSDVLRHLGSSGVESESSSNDVDLMVTRKNLLGRKCSSGFQSLGHISETECCPSPVFPTISSAVAVDLPTQTDQHSASDSVSASQIFGKKQAKSFAGESPCLSVSGSSRKRTSVPGCAESFSPDVSQHSIAHLMTSPLLDGSETLQKTVRNRSSTRRCLDQQMGQSSNGLSVSRHSSSKLTDEDS